VILRHKSPNCNCRFWCPNRETQATDFEVKVEKIVTNGYKTKPEKTITTGFEIKPEKIIPVVEAKPPINLPTGFEVKLLTNRWPWFWGSTKKHVLLVSTYTVQTANNATRLLDRPITEYLTRATILSPLHQVSYSCHDPHRSCHAAPATCTPRDKQMRFYKWNKDKGKTSEMSRIQIQTLACQWLITYQTKVLATWFMNLPLDEFIDNKSTKFEVWIQYPKKHS
jgi:hypothetical protein